MGIDISLYVKTKKKYEEAELRHLNYRFMEATSIGWGNKPIQLYDGDFKPQDDCFYYQVDSLCRYYGVNYSGGNWSDISMAINWLRFNFEDSEILYGGDSSADECSILTKEDQEELNEHWYKTGRLTYRGRKPHNELFAQICPTCDVVMNQYMWSGGNGEINCLGCGYTLKTEDLGKTWQEIKKK